MEPLPLSRDETQSPLLVRALERKGGWGGGLGIEDRE